MLKIAEFVILEISLANINDDSLFLRICSPEDNWTTADQNGKQTLNFDSASRNT